MITKLDPQYIPDNIADFYNELAGQDYQLRQKEHARFSRTVEIIRQVAVEHDLESCLEVGCAEGLMTEQICDLFGFTFGIDISRKLIQKARKKNLQFTDFWTVNIDSLNFTDQYDLIVACEVLEHLKDIYTTVNGCLSKCKYMIASCPINEDPNPDSFDVSLYGHEQKYADATGHIWSMDEAGFKSLFDGYEIISYEVVSPCAIAVVRGSL